MTRRPSPVPDPVPPPDDSAPDALLLTRARGALLGLVAGNQLAAATEHLGTAKASKAGAAMTLLLARSLVEQGDFDAHDVAQRWVKWMQLDGRGLGMTTRRALRLIEAGTEPFEAGRLAREANPRSAAGNGSIIRCLPVALRFHDNLDKLIRVSTQQAAITHADERCTWAAAACTLAVRELLHGNPYFLEEVLHRLPETTPRVLLEAIRRVPWEEASDLPISIPGEARYVVHCLEIAFWSAVHRPSLEEALTFLAEAGGDTDTNAAVAGALLGARDGEAGIPPRWRAQIVDAQGTSELADRLVRGGT